MIAPSGAMVTSKKARTSFLVRDMKTGWVLPHYRAWRSFRPRPKATERSLNWSGGSIASEDFHKLFRKGVESEGFLQEGHFGVHDAVANHRIAAMAAQEQHLQTRISGPKHFGQLAAAHARHQHVGYQ